MTLLVLGAIFCVLVVTARELILLRRQREEPPNPAEQRPPDRYKPRIFTFGRSGWIWGILDLQRWVLALAGAGAWWIFIVPELPAQPWAKYSITIVVLLVWFVIAGSDPFGLGKLMHNYDQRVYKRVLSPEERAEIESISKSVMCVFTDDQEEQSRILKEEKEQIDQMYRAKGL